MTGQVEFPVTIELRASRRLALLLAFVHIVSVASILSLPLDWFLRAPVLACILLSAVFRTVKQRRPLRALLLSKKSLAFVPENGGEQQFLEVLPDSVVFRSLIVLRLRNQGQDAGKAFSLVLLPDQMPPERFRLLRIWLRWQVSSGAVSQAF